MSMKDLKKMYKLVCVCLCVYARISSTYRVNKNSIGADPTFNNNDLPHIHFHFLCQSLPFETMSYFYTPVFFNFFSFPFFDFDAVKNMN